VVHDVTPPAPIFEIVGAGPLHPSVLISLVSSSIVVVWADPLAQHLSFMPMTDALRYWLATALQVASSEEVSNIVFDDLPVSYSSIRYGDALGPLPTSLVPSASDLSETSEFTDEDTLMPELVDIPVTAVPLSSLVGETVFPLYAQEKFACLS
jgi:hypothetical protein